MDVKVGDTVHVRGVVMAAVPERDYYVANVGSFGAYVQTQACNIVHVEPRALAVGDIVHLGKGPLRGQINAIASPYAWVQFPGMAGPQTRKLSDLVRA
jgi:hypothetical protein